MPSTSGSDTDKKSNTAATLDPRLSGGIRQMSYRRPTSPRVPPASYDRGFPDASEGESGLRFTVRVQGLVAAGSPPGWAVARVASHRPDHPARIESGGLSKHCEA